MKLMTKEECFDWIDEHRVQTEPIHEYWMKIGDTEKTLMRWRIIVGQTNYGVYEDLQTAITQIREDYEAHRAFLQKEAAKNGKLVVPVNK